MPGGMMGTVGGMGAWIVLWSLLAALVVLAVVGGAWAVRGRRNLERGSQHEIRGDASPGLDEARASLRLRYGRGEISREDYLQGKVELED